MNNVTDEALTAAVLSYFAAKRPQMQSAVNIIVVEGDGPDKGAAALQRYFARCGPAVLRNNEMYRRALELVDWEKVTAAVAAHLAAAQEARTRK
jgi:hypothetical protein